MIEKIKQNSKQKNIENKNAEKNEKKPEEESSQEVIKVCRGGGGLVPFPAVVAMLRRRLGMGG